MEKVFNFKKYARGQYKIMLNGKHIGWIEYCHDLRGWEILRYSDEHGYEYLGGAKTYNECKEAVLEKYPILFNEECNEIDVEAERDECFGMIESFGL